MNWEATQSAVFFFLVIALILWITRYFISKIAEMNDQALRKLDRNNTCMEKIIDCNQKIRVELAKLGERISYNEKHIETAHKRISEKCGT